MTTYDQYGEAVWGHGKRYATKIHDRLRDGDRVAYATIFVFLASGLVVFWLVFMSSMTCIVNNVHEYTYLDYRHVPALEVQRKKTEHTSDTPIESPVTQIPSAQLEMTEIGTLKDPNDATQRGREAVYAEVEFVMVTGVSATDDAVDARTRQYLHGNEYSLKMSVDDARKYKRGDKHQCVYFHLSDSSSRMCIGGKVHCFFSDMGLCFGSIIGMAFGSCFLSLYFVLHPDHWLARIIMGKSPIKRD